MKFLKDKFAIITGAAGLLGPCHAESLAEIGYNLILADINKKKLNQLHKNMEKKFKKIKILKEFLDITNENKLKKLQKKLKRNRIFVKCLVNNADINPKMISYKNYKSQTIENYKATKLKKEINVGVIGTFNCCKIFGSEMAKKKNGVIINISSDLGTNAPDQRVYDPNENIENVKQFKPISYSISKHAINGITKYIATYWGHKNVRCNTLSLGPVINNQPKFLIKNQKKRIPLNRWANKMEYKKAIQFLASDENSYMTGQNLIIDGGKTIW